MLHAEYEDGRTYYSQTLDFVDFAQFTVEGLKSLRVAQFVWNKEEHGTIQNHGMRTKKDVFDRILKRVYIAETDKCKIFVFSTGDVRTLTHWIQGSQWFDQVYWLKRKPIEVAPGFTVGTGNNVMAPGKVPGEPFRPQDARGPFAGDVQNEKKQQ